MKVTQASRREPQQRPCRGAVQTGKGATSAQDQSAQEKEEGGEKSWESIGGSGSVPATEKKRSSCSVELEEKK